MLSCKGLENVQKCNCNNIKKTLSFTHIVYLDSTVKQYSQWRINTSSQLSAVGAKNM